MQNEHGVTAVERLRPAHAATLLVPTTIPNDRPALPPAPPSRCGPGCGPPPARAKRLTAGPSRDPWARPMNASLRRPRGGHRSGALSPGVRGQRTPPPQYRGSRTVHAPRPGPVDLRPSQPPPETQSGSQLLDRSLLPLRMHPQRAICLRTTHPSSPSRFARERTSSRTERSATSPVTEIRLALAVRSLTPQFSRAPPTFCTSSAASHTTSNFILNEHAPVSFEPRDYTRAPCAPTSTDWTVRSRDRPAPLRRATVECSR